MCKADSTDETLRTILGELPFPGECTGRADGIFFPGLSLPRRPDQEVIQVWSNDPEAAAKMERFAPMLVERYSPRHPDAAGELRIYRGTDDELVFPPHDGTGNNLALPVARHLAGGDLRRTQADGGHVRDDAAPVGAARTRPAAALSLAQSFEQGGAQLALG